MEVMPVSTHYRNQAAGAKSRASQMLVMWVLLCVCAGILACETTPALEFTEGIDGYCPPLDHRCCPDAADTCTYEEMLAYNKCTMAAKDNYQAQNGRCLNGLVCQVQGTDAYTCSQACPDGLSACLNYAKIRVCIDTTRDIDNCGGCAYDGSGSVCEKGKFCHKGTCTIACVEPQVVCAGKCVDPFSTNKENCGGCVEEGDGTVCRSDLLCSQGKCQASCENPDIACGTICINPDSDSNNCGGCVEDGQGTRCEMGFRCVDGQCKTACDNPCQNGGTCTAPNKCTCVSGWTGATCQTPVCNPACQNGGTCTGPNKCTCTSSWTGAQCQTPVCNPACTANTACTAPNKCTCVSGWTGATCQTPECNPACQNGGTCTGPNICSCPITWTGPTCQTPDRVRIPKTGSSTSFTMGCFEMWCSYEEGPEHVVTLSAYEIDRFPVTVAAYKLCVQAQECMRPNDRSNYRFSDRHDHPINYIPWEFAADYCAWAGARLPTEAEWERASKGTTQKRFPWGNDCPTAWGSGCTDTAWTSTTAKANCEESSCSDGFSLTSPVNAFPKGVSEEGVWDMSGNVLEWTNDGYASYTSDAQTNPVGDSSSYTIVVRGGSYQSGEAQILSTSRAKSSEISNRTFIGFRCARRLP